MVAIGDKFKRFAAALAAGASAPAHFLCGKLPIALVLWNKLPERGWPRGFVDFLKHPPRWFVGLSLPLPFGSSDRYFCASFGPSRAVEPMTSASSS